MKKTLCLVLALVLTFTGLLCSCGESSDTLKVGICNYVDDASLNQIAEGIQTTLNELAEANGKKLKIEYKNANADASLMSTIISGFITDKVDLMIGIATPVAMAMQAQAEDTDIPVIFAAVSDPVGAGLVESLESTGGNITGSSDYLDTTSIMDLVFAVNPDVKKVGFLYDVGQDSSKTAVATAKAYLELKGITVVEKTGSTVSEISLAADALIAEKVDAVFTPTDNSIMTAELAIYEKFTEAKIPHYCGADSFALNGAFIGYGVKYDQLGVETAKLAGKILFEGKQASELSVMLFDNGTATINTETCSALGLDLEKVKTAITPYCNKIETLVTAEEFTD